MNYKNLMAYPFRAARIAIIALCVAATSHTFAETSGSAVEKSSVPKPGRKGVVLLGEFIADSSDTDKKQFVDLEKMILRFKIQVQNLTVKNATLKEMVPMTATAVEKRPSIVIIIAGRSDQKSKTTDEEQQDSLAAIIVPLKSSGARVYVLASDAGLGAGVISNLRLASTANGATFIETGGEASGKPYEFALSQIQEYEAKGPTVADTPKPNTPHVTKIAEPPMMAAPVTSSSADLLTTATVAAPIIPATTEQLISEPATINRKDLRTKSSTSETTNVFPPGSPVEVAPGDRTANIKMNPPPALKGFTPKQPVDRRDVNSKAPAVSR